MYNIAMTGPRGVSVHPFVRLSVMLLHPTQRLELFGNFLHAPSNSLGSRAISIKIFEKNQRDIFQMMVQIKWNGRGVKS